MRPQFVSRLIVAVLVSLVACSAAPTTAAAGADRPSLLQQVATEFGLAGFGSCDEVLDFLQTNALDQVTAWGLNGGVFPMLARGDVVMAAEGDASGAGTNYSTTNLQEIGVDEADIVKTNGSLLLALSGSRLHIVDVSGEPERLATFELGEFSATGLFLGESNALVVGSTWSGGIPVEGMAIDRMIAPDFWPVSTTVDIVEIDLTDPRNPQKAASVTMTGSLLASRMVDDSLRVVVSSLPANLPFITPDQIMAQWAPNQQQHPTAWQRAEQQALSHNQSVITASSIDDWLNPVLIENANGVVRTSQADCESLARPTEFSGLSLTSVLAFDNDLDLTDQFGLVSDSQTVYATADNVYVATQQWRDWAGVPADQWGQVAGITTTEIHRFDLSDPTTIEYRGSGDVAGWLYSQWALSENDGFLRVASTNQSPFWGQVGQTTQSMVTVLEVGDEAMEQVGFVAGLGRDENIYAVRFVGDQGYVVTYRQVDPLYVIDLSDPTEPHVAGELKIPGYSAYLHPVSEGMLLGVGQDGDLDGRILGTQVALFDVTDPENPRQIDKITFPGAYSGAEWDHHAFLYWPETDDQGLMVIPLQGQTGDQWWNGSMAIEVDGSRLGSTSELTQNGYVLRNLIVDGQLLTVSDLGIQAYDLSTFDPTDWVPFS